MKTEQRIPSGSPRPAGIGTAAGSAGPRRDGGFGGPREGFGGPREGFGGPRGPRTGDGVEA